MSVALSPRLVSRARSSFAPFAAASLLALAVGCSSDAGTVLGPDDLAAAKKPKSPPAAPADTAVTKTDSTAAGGTTAPTTPSAPATPTAPSSANPLAGATLFVSPTSNARSTANAWRATRPADAAQLEKIAAQPQATWLGNWNADVRTSASSAVTAATSAGGLAVLVAYNIPQRDCGGLSGGNTSTTASAYRTWITALADGIGMRRAIVVVEPDALAGMDCLSATDRDLRVSLLKDALTALRTRTLATVYLDAGNSAWHSAATAASRLNMVGIADIAGFALNVSNFRTTSELVAYGNAVSALVGNKHYVLDTSRNGLGPDAASNWCNPEGRALGARPTTATGQSLVDAYLWIKAPGDSDGACNGYPAAGTWLPEYALGLAKRAAY